MNRENRTISLLALPACAPDYKTVSDAAIHDLGLDYLCGQITEKKSEQTLLLSHTRIYLLCPVCGVHKKTEQSGAAFL